MLRKCQSQFSGENKKTIINLSSAEYTQRVVKDKKETDIKDPLSLFLSSVIL